jgi:hypothetical protein
MAKDKIGPGTFGGVWTRPPSDGRGHSQRELQDRASFDNQASTGCGGLLIIGCVTLGHLAWRAATGQA